jgi:hypothetical protein
MPVLLPNSIFEPEATPAGLVHRMISAHRGIELSVFRRFGVASSARQRLCVKCQSGILVDYVISARASNYGQRGWPIYDFRPFFMYDTFLVTPLSAGNSTPDRTYGFKASQQVDAMWHGIAAKRHKTRKGG